MKSRALNRSSRSRMRLAAAGSTDAALTSAEASVKITANKSLERGMAVQSARKTFGVIALGCCAAVVAFGDSTTVSFFSSRTVVGLGQTQVIPIRLVPSPSAPIELHARAKPT